MKASHQPETGAKKNSPDSKPNKNATNPKKPNNDPDQTPNREVENIPRAKPGTQAPGKNKIGFKK
jgi:hypothetical protein